MLRKVIILANLMVFMAGCSDNPREEEAPVVPQVQFSAFLNTGDEEVQIDFETGAGAPLIVSLSEELGLAPLLFSRRQISSNSIAFYSWFEQQTRVYFKDLDSGTVYTAENICNLAGEAAGVRGIRRISGNGTYVVVALEGFGNGPAPGFFFRILDKATGSCREVEIPEVSLSGPVSFSLSGDLLAVYHWQEGSERPQIVLADLRTGALGETLILDPGFRAATFQGSRLWLFNSDDSYQVFNADSGNFTRTGSAPGLLLQESGFFESQFSGDRFLSRFVYQQPSLFFAQPAVYDFSARRFVEGAEPFLPELQARVERETGDRVLFGNYAVDLDRGLVALIYVRGNGAPEGGVVLTNFRQEWLRVLPLPYVPERLEIREAL
ncbi:hypothetical protein [Robiginitalea marina]|uniref:DUF4221 domain-containing protein n=1 Tax=Robiginitalea marina TaxID=2954105 RepID=A0ABT1B298_9FLAO|nr:hypothetical protein [Robiginitalea marina]MCO5726052.1 hypothetical protein [Robiginitalea marina]